MGGVDIEQLRNQPAVQQLRQLVAQNPAVLQPLVQQLAESNPLLAQSFAQHPEMIYQLLGGEPGDADFGEDGEGGLPPGSTAIEVTEEERAAIERVNMVSPHFVSSLNL